MPAADLLLGCGIVLTGAESGLDLDMSRTLRDPPVGEWMSRNLPWVASIWLFIFVATKVLIAARLDVITALGLLRAGGPLNVTFAAVAAGLQHLLTTVAIGCAFLATSLAKPWPSVTHFVLWSGYGLSVFTMFFVGESAQTLVLLLVALAYLPMPSKIRGRLERKAADRQPKELLAIDAQIEKFQESPELKALRREAELEKEGQQKPEESSLTTDQLTALRQSLDDLSRDVGSAVEALTQRRFIRVLAIVGTYSVLFLVNALSPDLWIPAENLTFDSRGETVAYVVGQEGDWTTILLEKQRRLEQVPTKSILSREICSTRRRARRTTIVELIQESKPRLRYPHCGSLQTSSNSQSLDDVPRAGGKGGEILWARRPTTYRSLSVSPRRGSSRSIASSL